MLDEIKKLLVQLYYRRYIGGKHIPEQKALRRLILADKHIKRQFRKEYAHLVCEGIILRQKKQTGKGVDWHICLNPAKLPKIRFIVEGK